jgi:hypothetical protein
MLKATMDERGRRLWSGTELSTNLSGTCRSADGPVAVIALASRKGDAVRRSALASGASEVPPLALHTLVESGFLESEVTLTSGQEIADRIGASSGRSGLVGRVLQVVDHFGGGGEEMEARHQYEQALREGQVNVLVLAPTSSAVWRSSSSLDRPSKL